MRAHDDAVPEPDWLENLVAGLEAAPAYALAGSRIRFLYSPGVIDSAGDALAACGQPYRVGHRMADGPLFDRPAEVFGISACAALYRRSMLLDVGLFDEDFVSVYEDVDLSWRAFSRGHRALYVPGARVRLHPEDPKRRRDLPGIVTSGADGAFRFRGLEEGTYRISIQEPGGGLRPWNGPDSEDPLSGHLLSDGLQGVPAGTEEAILRVRRALPVTGRLVGVDGKRPPLDGRLLLVGDAPAGGRPRKETLPIRDDGSFRTPPLDPALTWEIRASGYEGSAGGVVKEVRPGARDLVVPLEAGLPLAGRVLDQDGAPVPAGARVLARAAGYDEDYPSAAGTATVEEDGRFEFPRLLSIPYRVAVEAGRDIEPAPSQETWFPGGEPALLRATRFFAAAGKVVDDEGNPVPLTRALARAPGAPAYAAHGTGTTEGAFRIERIPVRGAEIAVVARGRTVILGTYGLPATDLVLPLSAEPAP
ncbi:MAG: glycosyltransferase, partial [Planctomycetaceae bacterium]|nr:glycosyltransferase [Planctomycetaceae bacterium]